MFIYFTVFEDFFPLAIPKYVAKPCRNWEKATYTLAMRRTVLNSYFKQEINVRYGAMRTHKNRACQIRRFASVTT